MNKYYPSLFFAFMVVVLLSSCKKDTNNPVFISMGKEYFPVQIGYYITYDVDSTVYDELTHIPKTYKYRIKEQITQAYTNDEGTLSYRLERFIKWYNSTKSYDQIPWQIKDVWTITPYQTSIIKTEENIPYIKIIFPVKAHTQWDGNARNNLGTKIYTYEYTDTPETINNFYFTNTLKVKQYQYRSLIQYRNEVEKYAQNVGLVYKEITSLESQNILPNVPVENRVEKGFIFKMYIVDWKK